MRRPVDADRPLPLHPRPRFRRRSCGIVLSGAGSDGTLGLSEIKANGGRTFVEAPGSAEFPDMPQSAIDAGVADAVLPPRPWPRRLQPWRSRCRQKSAAIGESPETHADLRAILDILRAKVGYDFRCYKPNTLVRRIRRRMTLAKIATFADYAGFLHEHPEEVGLLQKDLLIGVTEFFRQPQAWEILEEKVIAALVENAAAGIDDPGLGPGLLDGQGGLQPGHAADRTGEEVRQEAGHPDLRHRLRRLRPGDRPQRQLFEGGDRRERLGRSG